MEWISSTRWRMRIECDLRYDSVAHSGTEGKPGAPEIRRAGDGANKKMVKPKWSLCPAHFSEDTRLGAE